MTKKLYFLLISVCYFISTSVLYLFDLEDNSYLLSIFVFGFIAVLAYLLNVVFRKRRGVFFKIVFVSICVFASMMILGAFPDLSLYPKLVYITFSSFGLYLLLLSVNIYIVSESSDEAVPLLQPAKSVVYAYQLMSVFFSSIIIYKFAPYSESLLISLGLQALCFLVFYFLLFRSLRWFYMMEGDLISPEVKVNTIVRLSLFAYVFLVEVSILLSFYPLEDFVRAMLVAGVLFITSNVINCYLMHKVTKRLFIDSLLILFFLYLIANFL